jgi:hypothetical protein
VGLLALQGDAYPAEFDGGSMRPKLEAACQFVTQTGKLAAIGALADATEILAGNARTQIVSGHAGSPALSTQSAVGDARR